MGCLRPIDAPLARYLHPPSGAGHGVNLVIGRLRVREEGQARIVLDEKV